MKRLWIVAAIAVASITEINVGRAQEDGIDKAKADAFDVRMFIKPPGNKAYACFVRRYDPDHLARHPKQKVSAMKLLVSAEIPEDEKNAQLFVPPRCQVSPPVRRFRLQRLLQSRRGRRHRQ